MRWLPVGVASGLIIGMVTVFAAPAHATPVWSITPTPNRAGAQDSSLVGVACPTTSSCFAVGGSRGRALVEHWDGTHWSMMTVPGPVASDLSDVSCPSPTSCVAVGQRIASGIGATAFVEHWDGTRWAVTTDASRGANATLSGVSCPSARSCFAVGTRVVGGDRRKALVERWDGTRWSVITSPNLAGDVILFSVSCSNARQCFAVGTRDFRQVLVERWNGSRWSIMARPNVSDATAELTGVSCANPSSCFGGRQTARPWPGRRYETGDPALGRDGLVGGRESDPARRTPLMERSGCLVPEPHQLFRRRILWDVRHRAGVEHQDAGRALERESLVDLAQSQPQPTRAGRAVRRVLSEHDGMHGRRRPLHDDGPRLRLQDPRGNLRLSDSICARGTWGSGAQEFSGMVAAGGHECAGGEERGT